MYEVERQAGQAGQVGPRCRQIPSSLALAGDEPSPLRPLRLHESALRAKPQDTSNLSAEESLV